MVASPKQESVENGESGATESPTELPMDLPTEPPTELSATDREALTKLVNTVALNDEALTLFAIAPESAPNHPVVKAFHTELSALGEPLNTTNFFYSDESLFNFLAKWQSKAATQTTDPIADQKTERQVIFAFGLEQLPLPRKKQELEQLNLAREKLFEQNIILVFWLSRERFLAEFRQRAPDFWDWRGGVAMFEARQTLLNPYIEWLIATNAYLTMSGVMQVNRQVDIFLDQIYVSLRAERRRQVSAAPKKGQREAIASTAATARKVASPRRLANRSVSLEKSGLTTFDDSFKYEVESVATVDSLVLERESAVEMDMVSTTKVVTESVDLAEVVRGEFGCSVILGAPGAGKTTLLKYLALHFAKAWRDGKESVPAETGEADLGATRLPIFFKIADYAEQLERNPELELLDYLQQFYRQWEDYSEDRRLEDGHLEDSSPEDSRSDRDISDLLLSRMRMGNCLILLDGLDEVFDQESRRQIVERINSFAEQFGHSNKLVVTSRIAGYEEVKLAGSFAQFTIAGMSDEQVEQFLYRWCGAVESAQKPDGSALQNEIEGRRQAEQIIRDIQQSEGVKRLTTNPLLLTILALIHRNGEQLPERRVKLYELAVQTLTESWQLSKKLPNAQKVLLPEGEVVSLLAPLAYWMHEEKPSGQVTHAEIVEQLAPKLADLRGEEADSSEILQAVEEFLRRVRETTGLFVERSPEVYGFMHLTFEEYFAAREMADKDPAEILAAVQKCWEEPRWEEPALLALGYFGSYSPNQFNRLVGRLFEGIAEYQPALVGDKITLYGKGSPTARIEWVRTDDLEALTISVKELLFAGEVIAQVAEVNARLRKSIVEKLLVTGLMVEDDEVEKEIWRLLQRVESFNRQGEVVAALERVIGNDELPEENRLKARVVKLHVLCGDAESELVKYVSELVDAIEPDIFCALKDFAEDMGEDMSPMLEGAIAAGKQVRKLSFVTAVSYVREKQYDKSIALFEEIRETNSDLLAPYTAWSLAVCYQEKEDYEKADDFYQLCFEGLSDCIEPNALLIYWRNRGVCRRLNSKYEEALDCFQHMLTIARETRQSREESLALYHLGRTYKEWGKYEEAITQYEQSLDRYQQLGKEADVANLWYWIANCYQEWGRYEEAIAAQQQCLALREKLDDQSSVAFAYFGVGRIYQACGKYEEAITQYEQSRDRYQQFGKETNVANQWNWIANCYRERSKYEEAIAAQQQCLALREKFDDQHSVAFVYYQLGRIYQAWGKYGQAVTYYEQGRDHYQHIGKEADVANQWDWIGDCYHKWGKYEEAVSAQQQNLALREKLDDQPSIASAYSEIGRICQAWGKYKEAIAKYGKSRDRYQQLDKEANVANQWYRIASCYREWGKYEEAITAQQQNLALREKLDDQANIAFAYFGLGCIYQEWGKYEEAIAHHEQSRTRYQQLGKEVDVANLWNNIAGCYREWDKYEEAITAQQQDLALREKLDDQTGIASAYYQFGCIYQAWGKYEEAIAHHEQSRDRYQQLDKEANVTNQWYWIANCYREWSKYKEAIEAQQQCLALREKLNNQLDIASAYWEFGRIYQTWSKYEEAIAHYEQSRDRYQQLDKKDKVANQWYNLADCYREWGKYEDAIAAQKMDLALREKLHDYRNLADAYYQLGRIYQAWGKYKKAISQHKRSKYLYQKLDLKQKVANQLSWMAACHQDLKQYEQATQHYQASIQQHQALDHAESTARRLRQLANTQRLQAIESPQVEATTRLQQAHSNLQQAIQIDTTNDYRENLAYDAISLALLTAEQLRHLPPTDPTIPTHIAQFEQSTTDAFTRFTQLGQTVNKAKEALDIARAYLEIPPLRNLAKAETLTRDSLQTFQTFNRRKLQAATYKLLGEIYTAQPPDPDVIDNAKTFFTQSLTLYRELDIENKALEVEKLLTPNKP
ncbi:MAG: tetratricopeptide repeat protein [Cyanobacteria bacterium P01_D01_bin.1]